MMNYKVIDTFKPNGLEGFTSKIRSVHEPCAPYVIVQAARDRLADESLLQLPEGYDKDSLNRICLLSGKVGVDFAMSLKQGRDMRDIGAQILALDNENKIVPPLDFEETQAIRRLVQVVDTTEVIVSHRQ